jgi:cytochrome c-type biogenesis protein CcmH/NrfG
MVLTVAYAFAESDTDRATLLYNHAEYSAAIGILSHIRNPDLELLGQCYFMEGDFRRAADSLEKAAVLNPDSSMIQTWLGRAWGRRAETAFPLLAARYAAKTRQAFEKAVQLDPTSAAALGDLFDFYLDAPAIMGGGIDKAATLLPRMTRYDPVEADLAQARIEEAQKRFEPAEQSLQRAMEKAPRDVIPILLLAQFLARRGRVDESEKAFQRAATIAPNSPRVLFARADSYLRAKRHIDQARDLLKRYLAAKNLTPDDPPRWEAINLLKKAEGA